MTLIRPVSAASRLFDSVSVKTVLAACFSATLSVTGWHIADSGQIKSLQQQTADHDTRLASHSAAIIRKVDRDTYMADQQNLSLQLQEIREREDRILEILVERPPQ